MPLRHFVHTAPGVTPTRWAWVLHGILGSGQNLRAVAKRLAADLPEWGFVLPDLRHHGESHDLPGPDTLRACVADLDALAADLGIAPRTAIGHSFGGKIAYVWGEVHEARGEPVDRVWAIDVPPGLPMGPAAESSEVLQVVRTLRELPQPLPRRDSIVTELTARGFSHATALWMTTNLRPADGGYVWRFNLDGVEALLRDYAVTDCWPWLASTERRARVDVVQAGRDPRWTPEELGRFGGVQRLNLHRLETGHWVHVEDPEGLNRLLVGEGLG